ncbi:hypothetical protein [Streptomyces sp. BE230]|uniref:hypothetical protein n=1 Tax=Streptomyces sp. BE230 TaxID=3002526 RepID=UPI002ED4CEC9|nr:hypothetical protein [Streptomyces sp. BE230]
MVAVYGKVVRRSQPRAAAAIQLLATMDHHDVDLAQCQVASEGDEIPSIAPFSATPTATTTGPYEPSVSGYEPRQISITQ